MRLSLEWLVALSVAVADLSLLAACSPAPAPVASSATDPSNPNAPESVDPLAHVHATVTSVDAGTVVYVCPMHADVTSDQPRACPKCGMILVPKK